MISSNWKDPKWLQAVVAQVVATGALFGVFSVADGEAINNAASTAIGAAAIVVANLLFVRSVLLHQSQGTGTPAPPPLPPSSSPPLPPAQDPSGPPVTPLLVLLCLLGTGWISQAAAAPPEVRCEAGCPDGCVCPRCDCVPLTAHELATVTIRISTLRARENELRALRDQNREILSEIAALRREQTRLMTMLEQGQRAAPAPAPQPGGPIIILPPSGTPRIDLQPQGAPRIDLPPGGSPRIDLPPSNPPRQELPPSGAPRIDLNPGGPPRSTPIGTEAAPNGYIRYTLHRR